MTELWVVEGPNVGARYALGGEFTFGRSSTCEAVLRDRRVSRRHAQIRPGGDGWQLLDLGSRNGVLLNGERIQGRAPLAAGDRIQIGFTVLAFDPPPLYRWVEGEARPLAEGADPGASRLLELCRAWGGVRSAAGVRRSLASALRRELSADAALLFRMGEGGEELIWLEGKGTALMPSALREALAGGRPMASAAALALGDASSRMGVVLLRERRPFGADDGALARLLLALAAEDAARLDAARAPWRPPKLVASGPTSTWSEPYRQLFEQVDETASHQAPVLLVGPGATGRSTLARLVHQQSPRAAGPFEEVRCGGSEPWAEALARAEGGTLYLRELGELREPEALEAALRALPPLPDPRLAAPVRLVACARCELAELVEQKRLSLWMAERLGGVTLSVPPLRERPSDIAALAVTLLAEICQALGRPVPTLSTEALGLLEGHAWPGNLLELRAVLTQVALWAAGPTVEPHELPASVRSARVGPGAEGTLAKLVSEVERAAIASALRAAGQRKIHAAKALGISRPTLDKKLAAYGLRVKR